MKILFWTDGFWPRIGGIETQGLQFIENLQERGHQCLVLAQKDHPHWKEDDQYRDIAIKRFDFNAIFAKQELKNLRPIKDYLEWVVKKFQPDVVHLNTCIGAAAFVFLLLRNTFHIPIVLTIHFAHVHENKIQHIIERASSLVDQIGCVSNWVLNEMEKYLPALKNKCRLIYNGLSLPKIDPSPLSFSPPTLLCLGRLTPEKGFETAIQAFSLLRKRGSNARLSIAGEGPQAQFLKNLIQQLGLVDSIQWIGSLTQDEVPIHINQATVVIVPSHFESFGLVALESQQLQRPVIASRVGGLPEVILDQKTGLLVPPTDPFALCKAIQILLEHPQQAIKMGKQGRKWAMEKFTLKENTNQYESLYKELKNHESIGQCNYSCV